jgi:hypothetical protein
MMFLPQYKVFNNIMAWNVFKIVKVCNTFYLPNNSLTSKVLFLNQFIIWTRMFKLLFLDDELQYLNANHNWILYN